jgi:mRNA interferase HigB
MNEGDEPDDGLRKTKRNHLISRKKIREFVKSHPGATKDRETLLGWCKVVEHANWKQFSDVRATFGTASQVGALVVFNVGGNKYRVVARIDYRLATVFIRHVLTHPEYDKGAWKSDP